MTENDVSDEDLLYHEWLANNISYVNTNKVCIHVMKQMFMVGFSSGYTYKKKQNAEEQLQK